MEYTTASLRYVFLHSFIIRLISWKTSLFLHRDYTTIFIHVDYNLCRSTIKVLSLTFLLYFCCILLLLSPFLHHTTFLSSPFSVALISFSCSILFPPHIYNFFIPLLPTLHIPHFCTPLFCAFTHLLHSFECLVPIYTSIYTSPHTHTSLSPHP